MKKLFSYGAGILGLCVTVGCVSVVLWGHRPQPTPVPTVVVPDLQNDVGLQQECAVLFRKIIKIQDNRETFRRNMNLVQLAFNQGEETQDSFAQARSVWLENENSLATEAAGLYTSGREKGCFQKVHQ